MGHGGKVDGHIRDADVIGDRPERRDGKSAQNARAMAAQRVAHRRHCDRARLALQVEFRRLLQLRAGHQNTAGQNRAERERQPPSPGRHCRFGQQPHCQRRGGHRQQAAHLACRCRKGGDEPAALRRRAFKQVGDNPGIFAADRKPHHTAHGDQQRASGRAHLRRGWHHGRRRHAPGHQRHRNQHRRAPAEPVANMAEHQRADRPHQVSQRETAERCQQPAAAREEQPR